MFTRPFIDSLDFAINGRKISDVVPIAEMPRLLGELDSSQGILSYTVHGGLDSWGTPLLDVRVSGDCRLRCQRCLNAMNYPVCIEARLMLRDQAGLDALGDDDEAFDSILAEAHLDVLNLLEEEILLSLPIAPRHEPGDCLVAGGESASRDAKNPFAVLTKLKVVK